MEHETARDRVERARVGRLATVTRTGGPHVVPCCYALDGDAVYSAVDAKPKSTLALRRLDNVRANPQASLLVDHYDEDWASLWWVRVDGTARVLDGDEADPRRRHALALLRAKYPQYQRTPPVGAVLVIEGLRWRSWP
jgi:PPOX class probable F420-dependent enzyme